MGGLAWTVGSFSNRYGNAGANQTSSGYYGTYLFGRTHRPVRFSPPTSTSPSTSSSSSSTAWGRRWKSFPSSRPTPRPDSVPPRTTSSRVKAAIRRARTFLHHCPRRGEHRQLVQVRHALPDVLVARRQQPRPRTATRGSAHRNRRRRAHRRLGRRTSLRRILARRHTVETTSFRTWPTASRVAIHGSNGKGFKEDYFGPKDETPTSPRPTTRDRSTRSSGNTLLHLAPLVGEPAPARHHHVVLRHVQPRA